MAAIACNTFPAVSPLSSSSSSTTTTSQVEGRGPICSCRSSNFFIPNFASNSTLKTSRLRISQKISIVPKHVLRVPIVSCLGDNHSEASSETNDSKAEGTVDLKLPRRSLLVHFTCNACGERTQKLINRLAYERGTVFVQCAGCFQHHKLIDNLGLVVEYDFREDSGMDSNADRV